MDIDAAVAAMDRLAHALDAKIDPMEAAALAEQMAVTWLGITEHLARHGALPTCWVTATKPVDAPERVPSRSKWT
jgi:hypothetical protein